MAGEGRASKGESADGGGPSMVNEGAAGIAQRLRDAGFGCEILDPAPTDSL